MTTFETSNSNGWASTGTNYSTRVTDPRCPTGNSCWRLSGPSTSDVWRTRVWKYLNTTGRPNFKISFKYNVTGASGNDQLQIGEYCRDPWDAETIVGTFQVNSNDMVQNIDGTREVFFSYPANCKEGKIFCSWRTDSQFDMIFLDDVQIYTLWEMMFKV